jgi:hypothetical protein
VPDEVEGLVLEDDMEYFQLGFDPFNLKVSRLRNLLVQYGCEYSSDAKKSQLVEIFKDKILSQRDKVLKSRSLVKPSAEGIRDAQPSQVIGKRKRAKK